MRTLKKNQRKCHYALPGTITEITDTNGNYTGERTTAYGTITELWINWRTASGEESTRAFGDISQYSLTMVAEPSCPLVEGAKVWVNNVTTSEADYIVKKVVKSINGVLIGLKEMA